VTLRRAGKPIPGLAVEYRAANSTRRENRVYRA
jgi:hypothetical protein